MARGYSMEHRHGFADEIGSFVVVHVNALIVRCGSCSRHCYSLPVGVDCPIYGE